jgi:hypothetical protein
MRGDVKVDFAVAQKVSVRNVNEGEGRQAGRRSVGTKGT